MGLLAGLDLRLLRHSCILLAHQRRRGGGQVLHRDQRLGDGVLNGEGSPYLLCHREGYRLESVAHPLPIALDVGATGCFWTWAFRSYE